LEKSCVPFSSLYFVVIGNDGKEKAAPPLANMEVIPESGYEIRNEVPNAKIAKYIYAKFLVERVSKANRGADKGLLDAKAASEKEVAV
jgi:hypothetical protein